ncbi:MAG: infB [Chlamydiales bacterium]|nr:infB [Chlamydiales bacterium]
MAKNLKLKIKNTQIAEAIKLGGVKEKLAKVKEEKASKEGAQVLKDKESPTSALEDKQAIPVDDKQAIPVEEKPRAKARSKSAFSAKAAREEAPSEDMKETLEEPAQETPVPETVIERKAPFEELLPKKEDRLKSLFLDEPLLPVEEELKSLKPEAPVIEEKIKPVTPPVEEKKDPLERFKHESAPSLAPAPAPAKAPEMRRQHAPLPASDAPRVKKEAPTGNRSSASPTPGFRSPSATPSSFRSQSPTFASQQNRSGPSYRTPSAPLPPRDGPPAMKLGPTGRHVRDLLPVKPKKVEAPAAAPREEAKTVKEKTDTAPAHKKVGPKGDFTTSTPEEDAEKKAKAKARDFREVKPVKKVESGSFDARDRQGLRVAEEERHWRKKRSFKQKHHQEDLTIRPTKLAVRLPITVKDLAVEMKLKASQLISKMFLQGIPLTLNDLLADETVIQLLGSEFDCEITIDTAEEERIRITDKSVREEIDLAGEGDLITRAPVVAFMGHVDHGKTSLIDSIRKSNRAAHEAGAITQHIGAFRCKTKVGDLTILDTPGHEAFSAMRARGADVTDIVVLVVAGDEGVKPQTVEAIQHAKTAGVTIVVAINKADKPNFNPDQVYRQLSEVDLLPEVWGGQTITVNCSAHTGQGIDELLEMLALQSEVLELRANANTRARGSVLEAEMHKGMGVISTLLVQNGTLRKGDAIVFDRYWGRVKTMRDEDGKTLEEAGPSQPVEVTGLSGLPTAGQEFIVVKSEKEARDIAEARMEGHRQTSQLQRKRFSMEAFMQENVSPDKKMFNVLLRADMQGSLEALRTLLSSVQSTKIELNIVLAGIGEISESDVQMAAASKAVIIGFHTKVESHAEPLIKESGVIVHLHDIIYNALDDVKQLMAGSLDKIVEEHERGKADVRTVFKSSHLGLIAGCQVTEGSIHRNHKIRIKREGKQVFRGSITSLRRIKEDVREVQKGFECGILISQFSGIQAGDVIEAFEEVYKSQQL